MYEKFFKRFLDIIFSALGLIILSPLLLITYIFVVAFLGFPGIFIQERPGKNEKIFKLYKFRTMTNKKDKNGKLLSDEKRLTKFGKFLRSTSIDELPELLNILKGDMSFVGPRPLLVEYLPRYSTNQRDRHKVRPGLTGYAQVHGRNTISWNKKFKMDLWYTKNISFAVDTAIVFKTISTVFMRSGISSNTSSTMEEFLGNSNNSKEH